MRRQIIQRPPWVRLSQGLQWPQKVRIAEMVGYTPHLPGLEIHSDTHRFRVLVCGRRFGKTKIISFESICVSIVGGYVVQGGPTYDLARKAWDETLQMVHSSQQARQLVSGLRESEGQEVLAWKTGGRIKLASGNSPKTFLGDGNDLVALDEWAQEEDPTVWGQYIMPTLLDRQGGAIFGSTPWGGNQYKDLFERGWNGEARWRNWRSWQKKTADCGLWTAEDIKELVEGEPERIVQQEIYAQFIDDVGSIFRGFKSVADAEWLEDPEPGHVYVIGCDIALVEDFTVIAVYDLTARKFVWVDRFNQISYTLQVERIAAASRKWNNAAVMIDATNNYSVAEQVEAAVPGATVGFFIFTAASKPQVINQFAYAIEHKELHLLNDETELGRVVLTELGSYRYERSPSGNLRMNAPPGKHDDCVIASALAYEAAVRNIGTGTVVVVPGRQAPTVSGSHGRGDGPRPSNMPVIVRKR